MRSRLTGETKSTLMMIWPRTKVASNLTQTSSRLELNSCIDCQSLWNHTSLNEAIQTLLGRTCQLCSLTLLCQERASTKSLTLSAHNGLSLATTQTQDTVSTVLTQTWSCLDLQHMSLTFTFWESASWILETATSLAKTKPKVALATLRMQPD